MATATADAKHTADRGPTIEESEIADREAKALEESGEEAKAAEHEKEMARLGVEQKGEGKID